ncbi:DEAD/DEAH box helicase, partial [Enterococcus faecalis]
KTLVICTNTSIREMWAAEVRKWFGFEPGIIGSGKYNIDPPIVVSNIQTVNKHANNLSKVFGTVIVDEVHHCVATTFTNFLEISCARYKIGL